MFVHFLFPNPCPCIVGLVIVLYQRWWLYKLYARQPLDQCQSGRSYLVECNYIALPCRHQASQCAAYNSPTEGVQCKQRHTVIFDPAQVWQSLICRLGRGGAADSAKHREKYLSGVNIFQGCIFFRGEYLSRVNIFQG